MAKKRPKLLYFFLNGDLHKKILINRGKDTIHAWNYPKSKLMVYTYSDTLRKFERAFSTVEVGVMLNRAPKTIKKLIHNGTIEQPQFTYGLESREMYTYKWRESDIMDLLEYFSTVHFGRPRHDGLVNPMNLPTPRELRAMIHDDQVLYVKQGDGFVPTWRAKDF